MIFPGWFFFTSLGVKWSFQLRQFPWISDWPKVVASCELPSRVVIANEWTVKRLCKSANVNLVLRLWTPALKNCRQCMSTVICHCPSLIWTSCILCYSVRWALKPQDCNRTVHCVLTDCFWATIVTVSCARQNVFDGVYPLLMTSLLSSTTVSWTSYDVTLLYIIRWTFQDSSKIVRTHMSFVSHQDALVYWKCDEYGWDAPL